MLSSERLLGQCAARLITDMHMIRKALAGDLEVVRSLFLEYQAQLGIDLCFQGFHQELADLPGCYDEPRGAIFIACIEARTVGCVGVRPLSATLSELKRLYVKDEFKGRGLGKLLCNAAIEFAGTAGYSSLVLDTLPQMMAAKRIYRQMGFMQTAPYYSSPLSGTEYYRIALG